MAVFSYLNAAPIWQDTIGAPVCAFLSITPTRVVILNDDGTHTILTGTGFTGSVGVGGALTGGTVTSMAYPNASELTTLARLTGPSYSAVAFNNATSGDALFNNLLAGNDTVNGTRGNDVFLSSAGGDLFNGGRGIDEVSYAREAAGAMENLLTGVTGGSAALDVLKSIENLTGSQGGNDTLTGDGSMVFE